MQGQSMQFVSARAGEPFHMTQVLGGSRVRRMLQAQGIEPGKVLTLEEVAQAQSLPSRVRNPVVIFSREGLRLFLERHEGERILVQKVGPEN
jgi:Fe2+ transport system protein FeoA